MPGADERGNRVAADGPGASGDEHTHAKCPSLSPLAGAEHDRNRQRSADCRGVAPGDRTRQVRLAGSEFLQRGSDFELREGRAEAVVRAVSECDWSWTAALYVKLVGLVENGGIAVSGGDDDEGLLAGSDLR